MQTAAWGSEAGVGMKTSFSSYIPWSSVFCTKHMDYLLNTGHILAFQLPISFH